MEFVDHSVVYRRQNGVVGSGTIVHFSANFLVLEIYGSNHEIRLNEVFASVRVSRGEVLFYDGRGVVCDLAEASSIQLLALYLRDSCIAVSNRESESESQFACEAFLAHYLVNLKLPMRLQQQLFQFADGLSQLLSGLKGSRLQVTSAGKLERMRSVGASPPHCIRALETALAHLDRCFRELNVSLQQCSEAEHVEVGAFFKRHIFPLSGGSRLFRWFHSPRRSSYLNHQLLSLVESERKFASGSMRGQLLDAFFKAFAGLEGIERRSHHWVSEIRQELTHHSDPLRVLMIGTDPTPALIANALSAESCARVQIDVYCTPNECAKAYLGELESRVKRGKKLPEIRLIRLPVNRLLSAYFHDQTAGFGRYDRVFSTSFFESLSGKTAACLVGFCLRLLEPGGNLQLFSSPEGYSPVREHWLLWFAQQLEVDAWKCYLPVDLHTCHTKLQYGHLTAFESTCASP